MPRSRRDVGSDAEDRAAAYLLGQGFTLVTRRYCVRGGELDLVCYDGAELVFVEVKSRQDALPEESLTSRKAGRLRTAARAFLNSMGASEQAHRFDLVAIEGADIRHHRGVFDEQPRAEAPPDDDVD